MCETGEVFNAACLAMICHHCGQRYVELFPNAMQENLFIGMLRAFTYMGVPRYVLTDNIKSVVIRRDRNGQPVWNLKYVMFMSAAGFRTRLYKSRHPFKNGKIERLVRFVKDNFIAVRTFRNYNDLNESVLQWCDRQNRTCHKAVDMVPDAVHQPSCLSFAKELPRNPELLFYMCLERRISFDGFVNYEGRRFGVPYRHMGKTVRVCRRDKFNEYDSLLCTLDRIINDVLVFMLSGQIHRGKNLEAIALTTARSKSTGPSETSTID